MPNSEKQPLVHFDKDGLFSQEPSSCIKHHYMHGWDGNRWWGVQRHHVRILTDRREQESFCRGDKARDTWLQRQLPDRNNLRYFSLHICLWGWKKKLFVDFQFSGNLPQSLWAKLQILQSGVIVLCVRGQERTEVKGFKIVHTAPDENKDRDCAQE